MAYAFERTNGVWGEQQELTINDCRTQFLFGGSVALSADGRVALLGRPNISDELLGGEAHVFVRNAMGVWGAQPPVTIGPDFEIGHPITPSGDEPGFGDSVALSGDGRRLLIGGNHFITGSGPVYVFKRAGAKWTELQKIIPPAGVEFDQIALAADGNTALIGAPDSLQAYVLVRGGVHFRLQQILTGPVLNRFGASVSVTAHGGRLLVGASGVGDTPGAAYAFRKSGGIWKLKQTLTPSDSPQDGFGASVAISKNGGAVLVGSPDAPPCEEEFCLPEPCEGLACGAAYVFRR
ncbi:MAG: hypothetical protein ACREVJ_00040 [Gammaproteobacteria bacterium]